MLVCVSELFHLLRRGPRCFSYNEVLVLMNCYGPCWNCGRCLLELSSKMRQSQAQVPACVPPSVLSGAVRSPLLSSPVRGHAVFAAVLSGALGCVPAPCSPVLVRLFPRASQRAGQEALQLRMKHTVSPQHRWGSSLNIEFARLKIDLAPLLHRFVDLQHSDSSLIADFGGAVQFRFTANRTEEIL